MPGGVVFEHVMSSAEGGKVSVGGRPSGRGRMIVVEVALARRDPASGKPAPLVPCAEMPPEMFTRAVAVDSEQFARDRMREHAVPAGRGTCQRACERS